MHPLLYVCFIIADPAASLRTPGQPFNCVSSPEWSTGAGIQYWCCRYVLASPMS